MAQENAGELAEQDVHREHGYIKMNDGAQLAYVVWRPSKEGRFPVLLQYSVYADGGLPFSEAEPYLAAGYAVIGANARGSGCSEGENFVPFQPNEGPDGAQIVEWAGVQLWSTGKVGMIGNSNAGNMQLLVAAERPPHLKALCIAGCSVSNYRDCGVVGGMFQAHYFGGWALFGQEDLARIGAERRIKEWGDQEGEQRVARYKPHGLYSTLLQHPLQDDWWEGASRSKEHVAPLISVPTMLVAGLQDEAASPASAGRLFAHLLPNVRHKKLIYTNGGHEADELAPIFNERIRWLDHWLKELDNGVDKEPPVTVLWETQVPGADFSRDYRISREELSRAAPAWTTTYADWPVPNLQRTTFYLTNDAMLSRTPPPAQSDHGVRNYLYPTGTELVGSNAQFALTPEATGSLNYRTDPMTTDMVLLGNPEIVLYFSSEQTDTDFMVTLKDVDPDGNTTYLTRGFLRASLRDIDEARTWPDEINPSFRKAEKLEPGKIYEARFSLWTMGQVIRQGHRLELSILAPSDIPSPVFASTPICGPSVNKVYHSPQYPSKLVLPVVPGEKAKAQAPACGTLWNQPCRKGPATSDNWRGGFVR